MKKILTGLALSSSLLFAGNYAMLSYSKSETDFANDSKYIGSIATTSYNFDAYMIGDDFLFRGGIGYLPAQNSTFTDNGGTYIVNDYRYEYDGLSCKAMFAYKLNFGSVFVGPSVGAIYSTTNTTLINLTDGTSSSSSSSGGDIPIGIIAGFNYLDDSFIYISYDIDDDIVDSDEHNYEEIEFGIIHSFGAVLVELWYASEQKALDTYETGTSTGFGIGVQF